MQLLAAPRTSLGGTALRGAARSRLRASRPARLAACAKLTLMPTGDGSTEHLGEGVMVPLPAAISLGDGTFEVGREDPAELVIPIPTVSSRHAILKVEGSKVTVTDLNSTNGTFVDAYQLEPMQATPLPVGAEVIFGDMFLARFQLADVPEPAIDIEAAPSSSSSSAA